MKTKLTLSIDKDLVHYARSQAKANSTSVSSMFSRFLETRKTQAEHTTIPSVTTMIGSLKSYAIDDSKAAIRKNYADKYIN